MPGVKVWPRTVISSPGITVMGDWCEDIFPLRLSGVLQKEVNKGHEQVSSSDNPHLIDKSKSIPLVSI